MAINHDRLKTAIKTALDAAMQTTYMVGDGHVNDALKVSLRKAFGLTRWGQPLPDEWVTFAAEVVQQVIIEFTQHAEWDAFADQVATAILTEFQNAEVNASTGTVVAQSLNNPPVVQLPPGSIK